LAARSPGCAAAQCRDGRPHILRKPLQTAHHRRAQQGGAGAGQLLQQHGQMTCWASSSSHSSAVSSSSHAISSRWCMAQASRPRGFAACTMKIEATPKGHTQHQ
jgi:hypothetical protein